MTPYTQEVEEALKWADTFGKWEGVEGIPDRHCAVLAAELRRQSQELEAHRKLLKRVGRRLMDIYADIQNPEGCSAGKMSKWMRKLAHECRELEAAFLTQPAPEKP